MIFSFSINASEASMFEELGLNIEILLSMANIPMKALEGDKFNLTEKQYKDIYEAIDELIKPQNILPLSLIESKAVFAPATFAGLCAENGLACIERIAKYKKLIAPYEMIVERDADLTAITFEMEGYGEMPMFTYLYEQINLLSVLRKGTGDSSLKPKQVVIEKSCATNIIDYFGVRPSIGSKNKLVFSNHILSKVFVTENNNMWDYLEAELNQRLLETEQDRSFSAQMRKVLIELMPAGISDVERIASELNISKRTLQRKLKEEGTTYNQQLNHTRELLVINYLKMDMCLDEIAFLVNYSDSKSLSRAFKIWTGISVTEYKDKHSIR